MLGDSGSKVKKLINFANIVQSKAFEPLMLETLKFSGMVDLNGNLCFTTFGGWGQQVKRQRSKNEIYQTPITFEWQ